MFLQVFALNASSFETYRSVGTSSCLTQSKWHSLMAWQSYAVESFQTRKHKQSLTGFNAASYSSATDTWYKFRDLVGSLMVFRSTHVPSIGKFANDIWSNSWNNWKILKVSSWTRRFGWSLYMLILFLNSECAGMGHRLQLSQQIYVQHEPHGYHENWTLLEVKQSLTSCRFTARLAYKFRTELKTCFWNW